MVQRIAVIRMDARKNLERRDRRKERRSIVAQENGRGLNRWLPISLVSSEPEPIHKSSTMVGRRSRRQVLDDLLQCQVPSKEPGPADVPLPSNPYYY